MLAAPQMRRPTAERSVTLAETKSTTPKENQTELDSYARLKKRTLQNILIALAKITTIYSIAVNRGFNGNCYGKPLLV
jgi:hypothetical protein